MEKFEESSRWDLKFGHVSWDDQPLDEYVPVLIDDVMLLTASFVDQVGAESLSSILQGGRLKPS